MQKKLSNHRNVACKYGGTVRKATPEEDLQAEIRMLELILDHTRKERDRYEVLVEQKEKEIQELKTEIKETQNQPQDEISPTAQWVDRAAKFLRKQRKNK